MLRESRIKPGCFSVSSRSRQGFTLVEMLVVMAIIGLLSAMIIGISSVVNRWKTEASARAEIQQILGLLDEYQLKIGKFPTAASADITGIKSTLEATLGAPTVDGKTDFLDPWGESYQYVRRNDLSCTVFSKGPDSASGTDDTDADNINAAK